MESHAEKETAGPDRVLRVTLPGLLEQALLERSGGWGVAPEECVVRILSETFAPGTSPDRLDGEIRRLAASTGAGFETIRKELQEIDDRNRTAYESLVKTLAPDRKEWGMLAGAGSVAALLLVVLLFVFARPHKTPPLPRGTGVAIPSQLSSEDRYTYFIGRWYQGVRDRMPTKDRLYLENYLKPFDNFDEDLKARKKAGL